MLHVIATIQFKPEKLDQLSAIYRELVPDVLNENGCIQYQPTCDYDASLPNQIQDSSRLIVTEIWESEEAFRAHLQASHVIKFREKIKGIVEKVTVQVLSPLT